MVLLCAQVNLPSGTILVIWDCVLAINLAALAFLSKDVVNIFKQQESGGNIVNVSSKAGAAYTAS